MTALVIPAADVVSDADKLLGALLDSIVLQDLYTTFPVIVAFDGCKPEFIDLFQNKYPFIDAVINEGNRSNFAGNANRGLRRAVEKHKEDAIVVNQDCVLPNASIMNSLKGEGIASPTQVTTVPEPPITKEMLEALCLMSPQEPTRTEHKKVTGFCMYLSKRVLEEIGYFDEYFRATFEDDDLCARALLKGLPVEHVNIAVHHYVSRCGSYDGNRLALNLVKYRTKYTIPGNVSHADMNEWILNNHSWVGTMKEV